MDVYAPAVDTKAAMPANKTATGRLTGTSMAAPRKHLIAIRKGYLLQRELYFHCTLPLSDVAGIAASIRSKNPHYSPEDVAAEIIRTVTKVGIDPDSSEAGLVTTGLSCTPTISPSPTTSSVPTRSVCPDCSGLTGGACHKCGGGGYCSWVGKEKQCLEIPQ